VNWTIPADLRAQVQKLWDRGLLLSALMGEDEPFPRRLTLKGPDSRQLSESFSEVRDWISQLTGSAKHYRIVWRTLNHRVLGANEIPAELWLDSLRDALAFIGKTRDAERFADLVSLTRQRQPELIPWLRKRPLRTLELAESWPKLLQIVAWLQMHPRPEIYLRQIDLPGVHSKFIEAHRGVLGELFDLTLSPERIEGGAAGTTGFCRRYGFREKPLRVRFRILDPELALLPADADLSIPTVSPFSTSFEGSFPRRHRC